MASAETVSDAVLEGSESSFEIVDDGGSLEQLRKLVEIIPASSLDLNLPSETGEIFIRVRRKGKEQTGGDNKNPESAAAPILDQDKTQEEEIKSNSNSKSKSKSNFKPKEDAKDDEDEEADSRVELKMKTEIKELKTQVQKLMKVQRKTDVKNGRKFKSRGQSDSSDESDSSDSSDSSEDDDDESDEDGNEAAECQVCKSAQVKSSSDGNWDFVCLALVLGLILGFILKCLLNMHLHGEIQHNFRESMKEVTVEIFHETIEKSIQENFKDSFMAIYQDLDREKNYNSKVRSCSHAMKILPAPWSTKLTIYPHGNDKDNEDESKSLQVLCDFEVDGGGWTVIQKRTSGPNKYEFDRVWSDYVEGFGSLDGNYWIGLENIRALTKAGDQELRIELEDFEGNKRFAKYSSFSISDASDFYRLSFSGFSQDSTAGDSWTHRVYSINGMRFSTKDKDNDLWTTGNCAKDRDGGWWFNQCSGAGSLNGLYRKEGENVPNFQGILWYTWKGDKYSLAKAEMKIRKRKK